METDQPFGVSEKPVKAVRTCMLLPLFETRISSFLFVYWQQQLSQRFVMGVVSSRFAER
jgi:hypothetical protein